MNSTAVNVEALLEGIEALDPHIDIDAVRAYVEDVQGVHYVSDVPETVLAQFHEAFRGEQSIEDYAYEYAYGCVGLEGFALDYFDAERFVRDLRLSGEIIVAGPYLFSGLA
jgi:hypothetical protein